jgi:hypothetical protein
MRFVDPRLPSELIEDFLLQGLVHHRPLQIANGRDEGPSYLTLGLAAVDKIASESTQTRDSSWNGFSSVATLARGRHIGETTRMKLHKVAGETR